MSDIGPGDLVVCVDAGPHFSEPHAHLLTQGRHYRVAAVGKRTVDGADALGFHETKSRPGWTYAFYLLTGAAFAVVLIGGW